MDNRIDLSNNLSPDNAAVIASLQAQLSQLELTNRELTLERHRFALLIEHATDIILVLDKHGVIEYCSPSWERVIDYSLNEIIGRNARDFLHPDDLSRLLRGIDMFLRMPNAMLHREFRCRRKDGTVGYFEGSLVNFLFEPSLRGIVVNARDCTERMRMEEHFKKSLREKETLLKEIHHRVKNNLQLISSMLGLQAHHIHDGQIARIFRESKDRVKSMALIHEKLYQSKNLTDIDFADYITTLIGYLFSSYGIDQNVIRFVSSFDNISVNIDTMIHLGLLINELVSNALKYAFPDGSNGEIGITVTHSPEPGTLSMRVYDTGIGFPPDVSFQHTRTLGLQLVNLLVTQLDGTIALERGTGTTFVITVPINAH